MSAITSIETTPIAPSAARPDDMRRGIAFMLLSGVMFATMNMVVKLLSARFGPVEIGFFRQFFSLIPIIAMIFGRGGGLSIVRTDRLGGHLFRGVIGNSSMIVLYLSIAWLPLADATALSFATPLFITLLSVPLLGEAVGWHRWGAVVIGFGGVIVMTHPGLDWFRPGAGAGAAMGVLSAFTGGLMMVTIRQLSRTERPITIVFYFATIGCLLFGAILPFFWTRPQGWEYAGLAAVGVLGGLFQLTMTTAYRYAPASALAPFGYASILWSTLFGYVFWRQLPGPRLLTGAAIVIASGLYIVYRETRKRAVSNPAIG
jgi:drug/metabolite transporter (DMT)-like permease